MVVRLHTRRAPPRLRSFWVIFSEPDYVPNITSPSRVRQHTNTLLCFVQRFAAFFDRLAPREHKIGRRVAALTVRMNEVQRHAQSVGLYLFHRKRCRFFSAVNELAHCDIT